MATNLFKSTVMAVLIGAGLTGTAAAQSGPLSLAAFSRETGIRTDAGAVQEAWQALQSMGTTEFLGGMLGNFKLDESAMIAGAMSIGASEFDRFLRGGSMNLTSAAGSALTNNMTAAAGIDLSYLTGSFTGGGGGTSTPSLASIAAGGGASSEGACSSDVANALAQNGKQHVDKIVTAAMDDSAGFSKIKDIGGGGSGTGGFAGLSCIEKLFQNAGSDILFKPPTLGNLTSQLQNWTCGKAKSVQEQVASAFGNGDYFQTADKGGFFPSLGSPEANLGNPAQRPGMGTPLSDLYGLEFTRFEGISGAASMQSVFW